MRLSAIVVNYRRAEMTCDCLVALSVALERVQGDSEIVVVDNGSRDGSVEAIGDAVPAARVHELPENRGFPTAASEGIRRSSGEWVLLVNNDVIVEPDAVSELLAAGELASDVGSVAAQMRFARDPGTLNSAGLGVDRLGVAFDRLLGQPVAASETEPVEVFGASGGAALHRRSMLDEVGGMDETFFFALDDADLAWRMRMRGWRALYAPASVVHHHHGATTAHGSADKYFHVGLNRVRTLAKNADSGLLARYGPAMLAYDAGYVAYVAAKDRTLAPLRGRLRGLREWRRYRRLGRERRAVELAPPRGLRAALRRRQVWAEHSAVAAPAARGAALSSLVVFHIGTLGGPLRCVGPLVKRLAAAGEVEFAVPEPGAVEAECSALGDVTVLPYGYLTYARTPGALARAAGAFVRDVRLFRRELRRRRPDVVVAVTTVLPALLVAARLERVPAVVWAAEIYDQGWKRSRLLPAWGTLLAGLTERLARGIVCCSKAVARQFGGDGGTPVAVAYPPIGEEYAFGDRARGRARYDVEDADPLIAVVGNLSAGRGQDVAIRALARLRDELPATRLLVKGAPHARDIDRAYARELRALADELDVAEAVVFSDASGEVADIYAAADVVVNPARFDEPFGRVAPEALVAGRPVVTTGTGGIPEVIRDGLDGIVVPVDDPDAIAGAVLRLRREPELARELVERGRERVHACFGLDQDWAAWRGVLRAVLPEPERLKGAAAAHDRRERLEEDLDVLAE